VKFLLDMPISPRLAPWLNENGHDAIHAFSIGLACAPDCELLAYAATEQRIIITADNDFPHLLALSQAKVPGIILFRGGDYSEQEMRNLLLRVFNALPESTLMQSVSVVDRRRIRHRLLPL
jgi:predicted nuclease of predicted toxin-antitoxin system